MLGNCFLGKPKDFQYGICVTTCGKCKLIGRIPSNFEEIPLELLKYLNAINDTEERHKFFKNIERRNFVQQLTSNTVISIALPDKLQIKAIFIEAVEEKDKISFFVEILEELPVPVRNYISCINAKMWKYSVSANMIRKLSLPDVNKKIEENLKIDKTLWRCHVCHKENLKDTKRCQKCATLKDDSFSNSSLHFPDNNLSSNNKQNNNGPAVSVPEQHHLQISSATIKGSNLNLDKQIYDDRLYENSGSTVHLTDRSTVAAVKPLKNNPTIQKIEFAEASKVSSLILGKEDRYKTAKVIHTMKTELIDKWICKICFTENDQEHCAKCDEKYEKPCQTHIRSWECRVCLKVNEDDSNICFTCGDKNEQISEQFRSQTNIDPNLIVPTCNSSYVTSLDPFETTEHHGSNIYATNESGDLMDHCEILVTPNSSVTKCMTCENSLVALEGLVLRLCQHIVCKSCINNQFNSNTLECHALIDNVPCKRLFELSEIKNLLPSHEYEQFREKIIDSKEGNLYIQWCYNKNCHGYHLWEKHYEYSPMNFTCNKCKLVNCLKCTVIHEGLTCKQYGKLTDDGKSVDKETVEMFLSWIREGIAMPCPKCEALIEKDEGCDWVQCSFCNTEICWATRGPRWGPDGNGDTSGGCGCTKEKKCIETCNYCH